MAMAKSHKFFHKNPTASAPNDNSFAVRFKRPSITGAALSPNFASALANLLVACAPFLMTVRAPMTMVVIIPATEIATTEKPPRFFLTVV